MDEEIRGLVERLKKFSDQLRSIEEDTEKKFAMLPDTNPEEARTFLKEIYAATESIWTAAVNSSRKLHGDSVVNAALKELRIQKRT